MTAPSGSHEPSDAQLVARMLEGDREALGAVYDRYGARLYDFAHSMLRHREDAADAVADSFVTCAERLGQLRDPDRLRPWLYAVVRSECLRRLRARARVAHGGEERLVAMPDEAIGPERAAEDVSLRELVWAAAAGLADRDRALLDLHLRQGLEGAELGEAMGVSASNAYVMMTRLRDQVDRSLGALLIARLGREDCADLDVLLRDWDGRFSPLVRKRVARHVDRCPVCSERRRVMVAPSALFAAVPVFVAPPGLREQVLERVQLVSSSGPAPGGTSTGRGPRRPRGLGVLNVATVVALVVGAVVAALLLWPEPDDAATPQADSSAAATPTAPPTAPATAPPTSAVAPSTSAPALGAPSSTDDPAPSSTAPEPGELTVSTRSLHLGHRSSATLTLRNTGDRSIGYRLTSSAGWLWADRRSGNVPGTGRSTVTVRVDRTGLGEGPVTARLSLTWPGGQTTVRVSADVEHAPVVGRPATSAHPSCTVTVTATVTDESTLRSVVLVWQGPADAGRTTMSPRGAGWSARIGPVAVGGPFTFHVVAVDAHGNRGTGPASTVTVDPCAQ
jgi:RNA polymerase sigma factor (sigma-70 family)